MKWLRRLLATLLALAPVAVIGAAAWGWASLPEVSGEIDVPGLSAPVQVIRDRDGIPHIFAGSGDDAYFALGFVHAQDRLFQMEMQRRIGAGRLAEAIGPAGLGYDRYLRMLGLYRLAQDSYGALAPEVRRALDSYAAGVNAWAATRRGPLPPEFALLRIGFEPWSPADSLVWAELMAIQLSANERTELLRASLLRTLTPAQVDDLLAPGGPEGGSDPAKLAAATPGPDLADAATAGLAARLLAALPPPLGPRTASNEWVLSGARTESGRPILANDPHLGLDAPVLWYLARIEAPGLSVAGATVPGVPFTVIGHNDRIAWGLTTTGGDVEDWFVERVDPGDPGRYLTPGGSEPFRTRTETIHVRGAEPQRLTVRATRHGPVLSDIEPDAAAAAGPGEVLAFAFTGLEPGDRTAEALYRLNRARNWAGVQAALRLWQAPQQNLAYADVDGHVGLTVPGLVPVRAGGDGRTPAPGWSGEADWTGFIPFNDLPRAFDPPDGLIVNANNAVVGPAYRHFLGQEYEPTYRARRIGEMLAGETRARVEDSVRLQADTLAVDARDLLPAMLAETPRAEDLAPVLDRLAAWDRRMDRDRPEPLVYAAWLRALGPALAADELAAAGPEPGRGASAGPASVLRMLTLARGWCDDVRTSDRPETCADVLAGSLRDALADLRARFGGDDAAWRWGDAHVAPLEHRVFARIPVLSRAFDLSVETDGGAHTVNRGAGGGGPDRPFAHTHGAGLRMVADLADLAATRFVIATGQSGHPLSPHYRDMVERWRDGGMVTLGGSPEALAAADGAAVLTLLPAAR